MAIACRDFFPHLRLRAQEFSCANENIVEVEDGGIAFEVIECGNEFVRLAEKTGQERIGDRAYGIGKQLCAPVIVLLSCCRELRAMTLTCRPGPRIYAGFVPGKG